MNASDTHIILCHGRFIWGGTRFKKDQIFMLEKIVQKSGDIMEAHSGRPYCAMVRVC